MSKPIAEMMQDEATKLFESAKSILTNTGMAPPGGVLVVVLAGDEKKHVLDVSYRDDKEKQEVVGKARMFLKIMDSVGRLEMYLFLADAHMRTVEALPGESEEEHARRAWAEQEGTRIKDQIDAKECLVCTGYSKDGSVYLISQSYLKIGEGEVVWGERNESSKTATFDSLWGGIFKINQADKEE